MKYFFYKITIKNTGLTYVGSTMHYNVRIAHHKLQTLNNTPIKLYIVINDYGGWSNVEYSIIEQIDFATNIERLQHEQKLIDTHGNGMNTKKAYISDDERAINKYFPVTCKCGFITTKCNVSHHIKSKKCIEFYTALEKYRILNSISPVPVAQSCQ